MGCNESKEAVATNNTISRRPFRKKSSITAKDLDSIPENNVHIITSTNTNNDDVKDITINTDLNKDGQQQQQENKVDQHEETGNTISSPDHYFSSRKDSDVADESVVDTEEGYYSPHHDHDSVKDGDVKDGVELKEVEGDENKVEEEKTLADHEQQETSLVDEENDKGKLEEMKEPTSVKEDDVKISETPAATIVDDDKNDVVEPKEPSSESLTKVAETN